MKKVRLLALLLVSFLLPGCGPAGPRPMRVWGEVSFDGVAVDKGDIVFTPIGDTPGSSTGDEIKDGRYDVPAAKGPYAGGTYRVEIKGLRKIGTTPNIMVAGGPPLDLFENHIPGEYNHESTLKVTISDNPTENNRHFRLEKK